jgi:pre-mRNA-processing factor 40
MKRLCKTAAATVAGLGALVLVAAPGFANAEHHGAASAAPQPAATAPTQLAHMGQGPTGGPGMMGRGPGGAPGTMAPGQGYGPGYGMGPCQGYGPGYGTGSGMMGPGMMGPGMMGPGMMGPGMMGPGMMGPGMMGPGQGYGPGPGYGMGPGYGYGPGPGYGMGPGMMGPGYGMGPGMMGPGYGYGPGPGYGMGPATAPDKDLSADDVRARLDQSLTWHGNKRLKVGEVTEADDDTIVAEIVTQDGSLVQRFKVNRHTGQMQQAE